VSHPPPWLDRDESHAWVSFIAMIMSVPPAIDAQLKRDSGLNFFEYSILSQLSSAPGRRLQMTQLGRVTGGSLSRLSHAANRLEERGMVRRHVVTDETRCTQLVLTEDGMVFLEGAAPGHVREARRLVFDALDDDQVAQLRDIAQAITATASPDVAAALHEAIVASDQR
jgi:DNA-binding MarR family transcriptional regulator